MSAAKKKNSDAPPQKAPRLFLERLKLESFGLYSHKIVGPFKPGLNVVFGKNESGKTTLNAFVGGVLFGWEDARGKRNTYKPTTTERSGSLFFTSQEGKEIEFARTKNADGLQGPEELLEDIDRETFQTMFALTSDELRNLRNTTDVTAKLLTAGSGTSASPAEALSKIHEQIAQYTSRAAGIEHSLVNLENEKEELRLAIAKAGEEAERYKQENKEFNDIEPQKEILASKLARINKEIEELVGAKATFEKLDHQLNEYEVQERKLRLEEKELVAEHDSNSLHSSGTTMVSALEEVAIRDQIDAFIEDESRIDHRVALAQDNYTTSKAFYEAIVESDNYQDSENRARKQHMLQTVLSITFPCLFILAGIPLFVMGRQTNSLSFTALGIGLVIFALVLAAGALAMIFRPNKSENETEEKKKDAQWVMLQDKKKLESCEQEKEYLQKKIHTYLDSEGLHLAQGSLRRARSVLDDIREQRSQENLMVQRQQSLVVQLVSLEDAINDCLKQKTLLLEKQQLPENASLADFEALIEEKTQKRRSLMEASESVNRRFGEIKQELSYAKHLRDFDKLKLLYQEVCTRQEESTQDLARLLLARYMLETAISAWESKSQPEVYKQASRLLEIMTAGSWVQVRMSESGRIEVIDAVKTVRESLHLSLGTCQQLYLSLRIALLMTAENVGRIIPIMADDILVNFDEERRRGAASALYELAEKRQVIIFTCHQEIVRLMCDIDSHVNLIEL